MPLDLTGCRICLKPEKIMFALFQKTGSQSAILFSDMLNYCVDLQVKLGDELPNKMCLSCKRNLETAYSFKKLAEDSNIALLKKLSSVNGKTKVQFNNSEDLKNKIDSKTFIEIIPKNETLSILDTEKEIAICNTIIRKCKSDTPTKSPNTSDVKMEEEYLDEEYLVSDADDVDYEPPKKLPPKNQKLNNDRTIQNKIPIIKENIRVIRIDNYEQLIKKKNAIPIKERQNNCMSRLVNVEDEYKKYVNAQVKKQTCHQRKPRSLINKLNQNKPDKTNCLIKIKLGTGDWDTDETKNFKIVKKKPRPNLKFKEKHICPVCGVLTFTLAKHILTHDEIKPFSCSECPKSFTSKMQFDMHMKKHSGIKDQICEICGAAFFFTRSVIRHMLIHKGERPYSCHLCPKKFIANYDLTRHLKCHAGYKPYNCDTCTMSFNAKHQLINHVRIHTGEKPYSCEVCNVTFTYKVNLNNHVFKVHGVNLRYKSIYTVTPEVLNQEYMLAENKAGKSLPLIIHPDND